METFDLIILGVGSAGFAAAKAATGLRAKVALVDQGPLGGLCILAGCMPSKALIQSSEVLALANRAAEFGVRVADASPDWETIMRRKERLVQGFAQDRTEGITFLPDTELVMGRARFLDGHTVQVGERTLQAGKIILATGSVPYVPPIEGLEETGYLLSEQALSLPHRPESLIVIGGGVIALELGQFFARLGTKVSVIEAGPRLLGREDEDVSTVIRNRLAREGVEIFTNARSVTVRRDGEKKKKKLSFEQNGERSEIEAEEILVATGRRPAVDGLDLEKAGVQMTGPMKSRMVLDRCLRTTNPDILAAGDVTGGSYLVHVAVSEGDLAAHNALLGCRPLLSQQHLFISAAFTEPNIARVGLSEGEARQLGREVLVGKYLFADHGKAEILGETDGFVKMLADPRTGEILGTTIVGPQGAELIHEMACAITLRATVESFLQVPHIHPTLAEILTYPAEDILDQMRGRVRLQTTLFPAGYNDENEEEAIERLNEIY